MRAKYLVLPLFLLVMLGLSIRVGGTVSRTGQDGPVRTSRQVPLPIAGHTLPVSLSLLERQPAAQGIVLPLAVDGANTPELVPEALAYRHFISVTAVRTSASVTEVS